MKPIVKAALLYCEAGLSVVPVNDRKESIIYWRKYQFERMSERDITKEFNKRHAYGIAIICGKISGNLELIDLDGKNDITGSLFTRYSNEIHSANPSLLSSLVIAKTRNWGNHFIYKAPAIGSNQILARRPTSVLERKVNPKEKIRILIETRAEGGYGVVYPTAGYDFIQNDLHNIPVITTHDRNLLMDIARNHNQCKPISLSIAPFLRNIADPTSPFEDFNRRGDIISLLEKHGWINVIYKNTEIRTYFRRPGVTDHDTSGDYNHHLGLFTVFTPSTDFIPRKGYKPYAVYAILECFGNFKLAAKQLLANGYGIPYFRKNELLKT